MKYRVKVVAVIDGKFVDVGTYDVLCDFTQSETVACLEARQNKTHKDIVKAGTTLIAASVKLIGKADEL